MRHAGASLGIENAANSLGQAAGPLLGGLLFIWQPEAPYFLSGASLIVLAGYRLENYREAACHQARYDS